MHELAAVAISGSPSGKSRSRTLLEHTLERLAAHGARTTLIDLATLPADALLGRTRSPDLDRAVAAVADAHIVVAGTPVYRATYSGLLKVFFDLLPQNALSRKVGVAVATGGGPHHLLVLGHGLAPLFASLGAVLTPTGIYGTEAQFVGGDPDPLLLARVNGSVAEAVALATALNPYLLSPAHVEG